MQSILAGFFIISISLSAQVKRDTKTLPLKIPPFTPAKERIKSLQSKDDAMGNSILANVPFESVGPTVFGGRVADIEVSPFDPTHFYVGYASGGLWETKNNGQTFEPFFQNEMVITIGDFAVNWYNNTIWLGTGEVNSSRSSYAGAGVFKSTDGGKTWEHKGLGETHHIGRVLLHPSDTNTIWVAALGHLYSPNFERGVFKTTDGGATWNKVLFVDSNTGTVDLVLDPQNPNILYASTWERSRKAWDFQESGKGSGIWKSVDGGENWQNISATGEGFPTGEGVGRIGLAATALTGQTILFAVVDNQFRRPASDDEKEGLEKNDFKTMSAETFQNLDKEELENYLRDNGFPKEYTAEKVKSMVKAGEIKPDALKIYLESGNNQLFDTEVIGTEVYRSNDGGRTWVRTHEDYLDAVYYTYGYYFGQIRVAPGNPDKLYVFGVPVIKSDDGGKTWESINGDNVHVDHHDLWINPSKEGHLILGNDGGINISYDDGKNWFKVTNPAVGQFYYINVDENEPYNIYGGTQDNGVWMGPSTYKEGVRWQMIGQYPYKTILGGDGMQVMIDTRTNDLVYTGFQFGNYFRINTTTGERKFISPQHKLGERPYRFNWQTPIHLSIHNQDILYMGSQKVHRSLDKGETWEEISFDLTKGGMDGDVPFGTLSALHESPLQFGLLYAGSDDGLAYVSPDGGHSWENISSKLPEDYWVSRIQASSHEKGRVYICLNGYRWDNFKSLLFVSEDYGKSWDKIGKDLPLETVNVIKEDQENPNVLYVGTDHGLYISLDRGKNFLPAGKEIPNVAIHDVVIHPKNGDIIVGTHGRSIYKGNANEIRQMVDSVLSKEVFVFDIAPAKYRKSWGDRSYRWGEISKPTLTVPVYADKSDSLQMQIYAGDYLLQDTMVYATKGLNYLEYDLTVDSTNTAIYFEWLKEQQEKEEVKPLKAGKETGKFYLRKGKYKVEFRKDEEEKFSKSFEVK
ncbi:MAG: glycosyl hydrolase [Saprospiraceae bacterium]|nr:glycosyl hydrolase [Saprospiraceae bacterium]